MKRALLGLFALSGCASAPPGPAEPPTHPLGWLTGCWVSEDGAAKEVWSTPEAGFLFGYALTLDDAGVSFFEQMHIRPGPLYILNVYPAGVGPSKFVESLQTDKSVTFINGAHDYPQRIHYQREGDVLKAHIALQDGSNRRDFDYRACGN
ncbi:MAG: DUF6265 family protein [Hyphomonas sp.]|nr:DUF6265 family protein [Hyphomonas sp.]